MLHFLRVSHWYWPQTGPRDYRAGHHFWRKNPGILKQECLELADSSHQDDFEVQNNFLNRLLTEQLSGQTALCSCQIFCGHVAYIFVLTNFKILDLIFSICLGANPSHVKELANSVG